MLYLKFRRIELKMTQGTLAERAHVARFFIILIEKGEALPVFDQLVRFRDVLKLPRDFDPNKLMDDVTLPLADSVQR